MKVVGLTIPTPCTDLRIPCVPTEEGEEIFSYTVLTTEASGGSHLDRG